MKKLLIGLLTVTSLSSFAHTGTFLCQKDDNSLSRKRIELKNSVGSVKVLTVTKEQRKDKDSPFAAISSFSGIASQVRGKTSAIVYRLSQQNLRVDSEVNLGDEIVSYQEESLDRFVMNGVDKLPSEYSNTIICKRH